MRGNRNRRMFAMLMGMMVCMVGCSSNVQTETSDDTLTAELPPLVTTTLDEQTTETTETSVQTTATQAQTAYCAQLESIDFPEEFGVLKEVRTYQGEVYLLSIQQDDTQQSLGCIYRMTAEAEPIFTKLFSGADEADFLGLTDFDILLDGTICGLLCENTNTIPYEGPTFDPDTFDWDTYYENYTTQYRLVWYNENGCVTQKMGLSTLLELDQTARQTMAFTSVRCDALDHIYLTATIDDQEYLLALDENENLCTIQGSSSKMLALQSGYQWLRCGEVGMLLWEKDTQDTMQLYHMVMTDDALWKTQITYADLMTDQVMLAESAVQDCWYGIWDTVGIYRVAEKRAEPELLYSWKDLKLDSDDVADVLLLDRKALLTSYTAQGDLTIQLVVPEDDETTTEPATEASQAEESPNQTPAVTSPPVATPLTTMAAAESE